MRISPNQNVINRVKESTTCVPIPPVWAEENIARDDIQHPTCMQVYTYNRLAVHTHLGFAIRGLPLLVVVCVVIIGLTRI